MIWFYFWGGGVLFCGLYLIHLTGVVNRVDGPMTTSSTSAVLVHENILCELLKSKTTPFMS